MDKKQLQLLQLLPLLGIDLNPMSQMSSLVKLINESEGPEIQQQQFDRKMQFDEGRAVAEDRYKGGMLDMYGQDRIMKEKHAEVGPLYAMLQTLLQGQVHQMGFDATPGISRLTDMLGLPQGMFGGGQGQDPRFGQPGNNQDISDDKYRASVQARGYGQ